MLNEQREDSIKNSYDKDKLEAAIEHFRSIKKIEWTKNVQADRTEDGKEIFSLPSPIYPENTWSYLSIAGFDKNYFENYKNGCEGVPISSMSLAQLQTLFTFIWRGERFCDGIVAYYIESGKINEMLIRFKELVSKE